MPKTSSWIAYAGPAAALAAGFAGADVTEAAPYQAQAEQRAASVAYALAKANPDGCALPDMMTGIRFHDLSSYRSEEREYFRVKKGMGDGFSVLWQVPGSAADRSGLMPDDEVISVNGDRLEQFRLGPNSTGSYDRVDKFERYLSAALRVGPAHLSVRRGKRIFEITLAGERGCSGRVAVFTSRRINAWSDGRFVALTTGLMNVSSSDDELAFVIGHEMAHNNFKLGQSIGPAKLIAAFGLPTPGGWHAELESDRQSVILMIRAGFDPAAAESMLEKTRNKRPLDFFSLSHPRYGMRIKAVRKTIESYAQLASVDESSEAMSATKLVASTSTRYPSVILPPSSNVNANTQPIHKPY